MVKGDTIKCNDKNDMVCTMIHLASNGIQTDFLYEKNGKSGLWLEVISIEKEGKEMSNVIHPGHYNIPGRKECIEEMLDKFGYEKTEAFCELNSYKYQYRHALKNGQEDLEKAKNYDHMLTEYIRKDQRFQIADYYGLDVQMQQLVEEMAELTQAICKAFRADGKGQPVSEKLSRFEIQQNLFEELADVKLVLDQVIFLLACDDDVQEIMKQKIERCMERMGKRNAGD